MVPEVEDILKVLTSPPAPRSDAYAAREREAPRIGHTANYLERESQNRSLGAAGEQFVLNFERARLINCGREVLAGKIEHISRTQGDGAGFDILSFDASGAERMIEVKTTKYGRETPFFVSRNEVAVSETRAPHYHLYRLFGFREAPGLFTLSGALSITCKLSTSTYLATVQ